MCSLVAIYPTNTTPNNAEPIRNASPTALYLWGGGGGISTWRFDSIASDLLDIIHCVFDVRTTGNEPEEGEVDHTDDEEDDDEDEKEEKKREEEEEQGEFRRPSNVLLVAFIDQIL